VGKVLDGNVFENDHLKRIYVEGQLYRAEKRSK
jgi:hypothetical protein